MDKFKSNQLVTSRGFPVVLLTTDGEGRLSLSNRDTSVIKYIGNIKYNTSTILGLWDSDGDSCSIGHGQSDKLMTLPEYVYSNLKQNDPIVIFDKNDKPTLAHFASITLDASGGGAVFVFQNGKTSFTSTKAEIEEHVKFDLYRPLIKD